MGVGMEEGRGENFALPGLHVFSRRETNLPITINFLIATSLVWHNTIQLEAIDHQIFDSPRTIPLASTCFKTTGPKFFSDVEFILRNYESSKTVYPTDFHLLNNVLVPQQQI